MLYRYSITDINEIKKERKEGDQKSADKVPVGKKLRRIINLILEQSPLRERKNDIVTDFKDNLVSRTEITPEEIEKLPRSIQYLAEDEDEPRPRAPSYSYRFSATGTLTISELTEFLTSTNPNAVFDKGPITQALNIFLGHYAKASKQHTTIGANKSYSLTQSEVTTGNLGGGLTALRGFFSSIRVATTRILVNVNMSHAPFYNAVTLVQTMGDFGRAYGQNKAKLALFLKGVRVKTTHLKVKTNKAGVEIPRIKTIFGLANKGDGYSLEHPPRISNRYGGPKEVEFWLDGPAAPAKPGASPTESPAKSCREKAGEGQASWKPSSYIKSGWEGCHF